ncbi:MAG: hypothetical protein DWQ07_06700 [Chloroflexi bacterium]|nr:MAG: hypothetical protein DWQ07_06700 [Chloroflexota bacterium]MBL1195611.1 hypothetical protein [Chloroflexota bacterium]NOH12898.1 hypothetical protein [Chloroflexota bacterium]
MKSTTEILRAAIALPFRNPYIWLLAFIALGVDFLAINSYNQITISLSAVVFIFVVIILDVAILWATAQYHQGKASNFLDASMTSATYFIQVAMLKILMAFPAGFLAMAVFIAFSRYLRNLPVEGNPLFLLVLALLLIFIFSIVQVWAFIASCYRVLRDMTLGDALVDSWEVLRTHTRRLVSVVLPFLIIDLVLLGLFTASGTISYRTTFELDIPERLINYYEERGRHFVDEDTIFTLNRANKGVFATLMRVRSTDLLSFPVYLVDNRTAGLIVYAAGLLLLPFRIGAMTIAFWELTYEPPPDFQLGKEGASVGPFASRES